MSSSFSFSNYKDFHRFVLTIGVSPGSVLTINILTVVVLVISISPSSFCLVPHVIGLVLHSSFRESGDNFRSPKY